MARAPKDPKAITADTLPPHLYSREWDTSSQKHIVALYQLEPSRAPVVGVRVSIVVDLSHHMVQSYAVAEVFDGTQWHATAGLHAGRMRSAESRTGMNGWHFTYEGARLDTATLLEETRLAYEYRAMGPEEYAERERIIVTQDPAYEDLSSQVSDERRSGVCYPCRAGRHTEHTEPCVCKSTVHNAERARLQNLGPGPGRD